MAAGRHSSFHENVYREQYALGKHPDPRAHKEVPLQESIYPPAPYHDASSMTNYPPEYSPPPKPYVGWNSAAPVGSEASLGIAAGSHGWQSSTTRVGSGDGLAIHARSQGGSISPTAPPKLAGAEITPNPVELDVHGSSPRNSQQAYRNLGW